MYIEKYWGDYIGGTDDSLTLLDNLISKQKDEFTLGEIISETGLDKLSSFQNTDYPLTVPIEELEAEIQYAINLISDLSVLLLECKINGAVNISDLADDDTNCTIRITATEQEHELINKALKDFATKPLSYDLCEMVDEEDMVEMSQVCEEIRKELYG